jgi:hypothetical protein
MNSKTKIDAHWKPMSLDMPIGFDSAAESAARRLWMKPDEFCRQVLLAAVEEAQAMDFNEE